jgi:hypothetical protein
MREIVGTKIVVINGRENILTYIGRRWAIQCRNAIDALEKTLLDNVPKAT